MSDPLHTKVTADIGPAAAAYEKLRRSIGDVGGSLSKMGEASSKALDTIAGGLEKFNFAMEGLKKIFTILKEGAALVQFSAEMKNLERNVPVERLKMMAEATQGTVNNIDLMKMSMKALSGEMAISEKEMGIVLRAANTLGDKGFGDTKENAEKLFDSIRSGSTRDLKQFGIALDDTSDKQELLNQKLFKFVEIAFEDVSVEPALLEIQRLQAVTENWIASVRSFMGTAIMDIVGWLDLLSDKIAGVDTRSTQKQKLIDLAVRNVAAAHGMDTGGAFGDLAGKATEARYMPEIVAELNRLEARQAIGDEERRADRVRQRAQAMAEVSGGVNQRRFGSTISAIAGATSAAPGRGRPWAPVQDSGTGINAVGMWESDVQATQDRRGMGSDFFGGAGAGGAGGAGAFDIGLDAIGGMGIGGGGGAGQGSQTDELVAQMQDRTTAIGGLMATLSGGIAAGVDAAITGSESIADAAKKASSSIMKSLALEAIGRAAFEVGMGFAEWPAGGHHFVAAAKLGLAAVLLGGGSAALGGGGGGSAGASSTPGGGVVANNSSGGRDPIAPVNVYLIGDDIYDPDTIARRVDRALEQGKRSGTIRGGHRVVTLRQ